MWGENQPGIPGPVIIKAGYATFRMRCFSSLSNPVPENLSKATRLSLAYILDSVQFSVLDGLWIRRWFQWAAKQPIACCPLTRPYHYCPDESQFRRRNDVEEHHVAVRHVAAVFFLVI